MPESYSLWNEPGNTQGILKEVTPNFNGMSFTTSARLFDGAIWVDRDKTGDEKTAPGWYRLDEANDKWVRAEDSVKLPNGSKAVVPGTEIPTWQRAGDGAMFIHPTMFRGSNFTPVAKPGWYRQVNGRFVEAPAEQGWMRAGLGALKTTGGELAGWIKDNTAAELERRKALVQEHGLLPGLALGALDGNRRLIEGAGSKTLDMAQGLRAVGNKAMGSLTGDAVTKRVGQIQMRDSYMPGRDFEADAKLELEHEKLATELQKASLDFGMYARRGDIVKGPDGKVVALTPEAQGALESVDRLAPLEAAAWGQRERSVSTAYQKIHKDEMKGAGNLGAEIMDTILQTVAMEMTGGASLAAKGASAAGKKVMGQLTKAGLSEELAAKAGRVLGAEVPTLLEATAKMAGKGSVLNPGNVASSILKTTANTEAGLIKRAAAHAGQGLAMGVPGAVQQFGQLYAGDENRSAGSAFWETLMSQPHTAAVMVPMLSSRLRAKTMPFDKTSIAGATKNALARTGTLAGTSTLVDLVMSGGDPEALGKLPGHLKGLLGLELWGAYKGVGGAREAATKAATAKAVGENAAKVFAQEREALEAAHKTATEELGKLKATPGATPEEIQMAEEVVAELKGQADEAAAVEQTGRARAEAADETAKALGIPGEKLKERVEQFTVKPKKPAVADPVSGLMGPETAPAKGGKEVVTNGEEEGQEGREVLGPKGAGSPAPKPKVAPHEQAILSLLDQATVASSEITREKSRLNELVAEGAEDAVLKAQRRLISEKEEELASIKEEIAFRQEAKPAAKAPNFTLGEDPFEEEALPGNYEAVPSNIARWVHKAFRMDVPEGRTRENVKAYHAKMAKLQDAYSAMEPLSRATGSGQSSYPGLEPGQAEQIRKAMGIGEDPTPEQAKLLTEALELANTEGMKKALGPEGYAEWMQERQSREATGGAGAPRVVREGSGGSRHEEYLAGISETMDHRGMQANRVELLRAVRATREKMAEQVNQARTKAAATQLLARFNRGEALDPGVRRLLETTAPERQMGALVSYLADKTNLVRNFGTNHDKQEVQQDAAAMDALQRALNEQALTKGGLSFSEALRQVWDLSVRRAEANKARGLGEPLVDTFGTFESLAKHVHGMTRELDGYLAEVDSALPGHLDKAIGEVKGRQASLDRLMAGAVDPRQVQGHQLTAKGLAERVARLEKIRETVGTDAEDPAVSRSYDSVAKDWLEGVRLRHDRNQGKAVHSPFGGKLEGYHMVWDKEAGIYRVRQNTKDGQPESEPLARPREMEQATRPGALSQDQLKALWDVDHAADVPFGATEPNGQPKRGHVFNWRLRGGVLTVEPRPTALTTEMVQKGENGALADAQVEVPHFDMVRFTEQVNERLASRGVEPMAGPRRAPVLSPAELKQKAEADRRAQEEAALRAQERGQRLAAENLQASVKERTEQRRQIQRRGEGDGRQVSPENDRSGEIVREISRLGAGALAVDQAALYDLLKEAGAGITQGEIEAGKIQGDPSRVLSARELQALSYLWEQGELVESTDRPSTRISFRSGVGEQAGRRAGMGTDPRDVTKDREAELKAQASEENWRIGRGLEMQGDDRSAAWSEVMAQRKLAGRALAKLYRAGVLSEDAFLLPGENPHERGESIAGNPMTHRNAGHRRMLESALERAVEEVGGTVAASDMASELRYSFLEHRQLDQETAGLLKKWGGRWKPNEMGVEGQPLYSQAAAKADLPAVGTKEYQEHLDALGQNPHLRASMQRVMAYEQLLRMADVVRNSPDVSPETRNPMADALVRQAEGLVNAGDLALHAHIRSTTGSYYKPIMEPYAEPVGEGVRAGHRTRLSNEDLAALVNPNHHRHQEMLYAFEGGLEPSNLWRGPEDARAEVADPIERVLSHSTPVSLAKARGQKLTQEVAESIIADDARMTVLGEMNHRDRVAKEVQSWLNSGDASLMRLGSQWNRNKKVLLERTGGRETEAGRVILDVVDKMDPQLFATLRIEASSDPVGGKFTPEKDLMSLGERFKEMAKDGYQSHHSINTFFHEMTHFLTSYMDPQFRGRAVQRYQDHMERVTTEDPVMEAFFGKGSPLDWMTLNQDFLYQNTADRRLIPIEAAEIEELVARAKAKAPEILKGLSGWSGLPSLGGNAEKAVETFVRKHLITTKNGRQGFDASALSKTWGLKDRTYRFMNPDEYMAETFGNFAMFAGTNGRVANQHREAFEMLVGKGSDRVEGMADMLAMLKTYQAMKPSDRPTGGGNLDLVADMLGILRAGDAAPAAGPRDKIRLTDFPKPRKKTLVDTLAEEEVLPGGPSPNQLNTARDQLETAEKLMVRAAKRAGEAISPVARKAVELMAADAISPATRTFSHLNTWMDARYTAARAKDEQAADGARKALDKAFRREQSESFFQAAQTLVESGRAVDQNVKNAFEIKLFSGKIGGERVWINTDRNGKVLQVMTDKQREAYRYVESNGKLGGAGLDPALKAELDTWIHGAEPGSFKGVKSELDAWRREEMERAPGVDPALVRSMWADDYLAHLYPHSKGSRTMDRILEDRDSIASLDRFQRRVYSSYDQAFRQAGLLPRLSNPVDNYLLGAREGARVIQLRHALGALEARGLAFWGYRDDPNFVRLELGPKGSTAMRRLGYADPEAIKAEGGGPAPGHVRLWRVEASVSREPADWMKTQPEYQQAQAARGRWFTDDPSTLEFYKNDIGPNYRITYVDLPKAEAERYRVANMEKIAGGKAVGENPAAYSRDPNTEFFLPREIADRRTAGEPSQGEVSMPTKDVWIHKDVEPLIRSAFDYGLAGTAFGGVFKGAMLVNHLLSPAKLALSGFHLGMISRLGSVEAMRSTWSNYQRLRGQGVSHEEAMTRSFQATAGHALMFGALENGKRYRQLFVDHGHKTPQEIAELKDLSNLDKATLVMLQMGGYAPMLSPARETQEREALQQALFENKAIKAAWKGYTASMESIQDAIMNHTVAPAKTGHLVNDIQRKLKATYGENLDFEKFTRDVFVNRQIASSPYATTELGEYARHMVSMNDNTFGMTNYRRLMMNPILKDLMHAWNLSFGWRHGTMGIAFKALDDLGNRAPVVGQAYQSLKRGMGSTGIAETVDGRDNVRFMVTHGMTDILLTLTLGALGVAKFPNWQKKKDEQGNEIPEELDLHALRGRLEDLVFPVLSDRLNHNSLQNRYATGYAYDFWAGIKNPGKWLVGHTEANSPLVSTGTAFLTGKDAIGNEIGNPYGMMPKEWADRVATWMADPESSSFLVGLAKRGLQIPKEFVPISLTTLDRLVKTGEDPKVALFTLAGLRKLPDTKGFGQTDLVQAAMELRSKKGAGGDGKDAGEQEKKVLRDDLISKALNTRDAEPLQGLVGQGYTGKGVKKMADGLFSEIGEKGESKVRTAAERLFKGASFEDQLVLAELARADEAQIIIPILQRNATKGLARLEEANPASAERARARYEAILRRWGVEP